MSNKMIERLAERFVPHMEADSSLQTCLRFLQTICIVREDSLSD